MVQPALLDTSILPRHMEVKDKHCLKNVFCGNTFTRRNSKRLSNILRSYLSYQRQPPKVLFQQTKLFNSYQSLHCYRAHFSNKSEIGMTVPPDENETPPHPHLLHSVPVLIAKRRTKKETTYNSLTSIQWHTKQNMKWLWDMYSQITLFYKKEAAVPVTYVKWVWSKRRKGFDENAPLC